MSSALREIRYRLSLSPTYKYAVLVGFVVGTVLTDDEAMSANSVPEFFARIFSDSFLVSSILLGVLAVGIIMIAVLLNGGLKD